MANSEILKGLKKHSQELCGTSGVQETVLCNNCCVAKLKRNALDIINHQQAEIERLKRELDAAIESDPSKTHPYEVITPYGVVFSKCEQGYEDFKMDIKSEAIKEFAELVDKDIEEKLSNSIKEQNPDLYLIHQIVKNRLKEMVGEE